MTEFSVLSKQFAILLDGPIASEVVSISIDHGFNDPNQNKGECIALMHQELSEMLDGIRKPGPDSHCPQFTSETVELADLVIRAMDYSGKNNLPLGQAILAKMEYNRTRPYKHGKLF